MESSSRSNLKILGWIVVLALLLLGGVLAINGLSFTETQESRITAAHDSLGSNCTYNGELIRYYVFVDPDTGIEYLVNDRGGMCVRLDSSGEPMKLWDYSKESD